MTPGDITTDKMKTDNELIAEFMGYSEEAQRTDLWCRDFHENWSALMPVVEKIKTGSYGKQAYGSVHFWINATGFRAEWTCSILGSLTYQVPINATQYTYKTIDIPCITKKNENADEPSINCVYKAVVEFIKWYNAQKP